MECHMPRFRLVLTSLLMMAGVPALAAQETPSDTLLTVQHYLDLEQVADPQISPDGRQIVYVRRWVNRLEDRWESALWIMNADGSRNRYLTEGSNARWSPDGSRILYLATGDPKGSQIHVRWMDAEGATSQITRVEKSPMNPQWAPDGKSIAFVMAVPAESKWAISMPTPPDGAKWTAAPRIVDRLHYRQDRVGYTDPVFTHLFVVPADGGTARQLTSGEWNVGARFDGLLEGIGFAWTPDGTTILFDGLMGQSSDDVYVVSHIYALDVASGTIRPVTARPGFWTAPLPSPDGRLVAFAGFDSSAATYSTSDLHVIPLAGGESRNLTRSFDREMGAVRWAPDGGTLYFSAPNHGSLNVYQVPAGGGAVQAVVEGAQVLSLASVAPDRDLTAVGVVSTPSRPADVARYSLRRPSGVTRLTDVNGDLLANKRVGELEEVWYTSSGGTRVQGWIVKPPSFDPGKQYPLIMEIHGGPFGMYGVGFNYMFQNFAANGYLVLYTNPRGSTGYGTDFHNGIDHAYPGVDYDDLMAGVDAVIAKGIVDTTRMYVGGCSGGGVLSSWVIGHTNRFAAAAVRCPVINWMSFLGTSDVPYFTQSFFREPFWENPQRWLEQSSLMYVGNVTTPTAIMTGELDLRTPMPQSEEYYAALRLRGVETVLLRFKEEYHGTGSKPSNFMRTQLYMMSWYQRHTRAPGAQATR
jgi:dipeptidyl aminopeptidase/acylaminoacyl peptidase